MLNQPEYLDLIVRYLNNLEDEILHAQITSFCAESKRNESYFKEVERIWKLSSSSARLNLLNEKQSVENFRIALNKISGTKSYTLKWLTGVAATILLISTIYLVFNKVHRPDLLSLTTGNNIDSVKLSDGSIVVLAENTIVKYPKVFSSKSREIYLCKGRAFFRVAKDPKHPFSVTMGDSKVSVLGTSFNIDYSPSKINLDVKTGRVMFSPYLNGTTSILTAGQALTYSIQKREFTARASQNADSWLTKELVFVDMPLEDVCNQLSDYYKIAIKLESKQELVKKFNANFKGNSLEEVLEVLKETYGLKIKKTKDNIILKTP